MKYLFISQFSYKASNTILISHFLLALACCFFITEAASAQKKREILILEKEGDRYIQNNNFYLALPIFQKLEETVPVKGKYNYQLGISYYKTHAFKEALPYLEACMKKADKYPATMIYYAAHTYHLNYKLDEATRLYQEYLNRINHWKNKKSEKEAEEIKRLIAMCSYAKQMMADSSKIIIKSLGNNINSPFPEYAPVVSMDEKTLIFTSCRPGSIGGWRDEVDGSYFEDIYMSGRTENGWSDPVSLGPGINTTGHDAGVALNAEANKLLLYWSDATPYSSSAEGNLFLSELKNGRWQAPQKLGTTLAKYWEPSASFSLDENSLLFASRREGGLGGTDLFIVRRLPDGKWAEPQNLGNTINTPYDEDAPFLNPDGKTLYFSSNGHQSMGGYDIFVSTYDETSKTWTKPKNLGYPINTVHDDLYVSFSADSKRMYFSSIRPEGKGNRDLFVAEMEPENPAPQVFKGVIRNQKTNKPLGATLSIKEKDSGKTIGLYQSDSKTGHYLLLLPTDKEYVLDIQAKGFKEHKEVLNGSSISEAAEIKKDISLLPN